MDYDILLNTGKDAQGNKIAIAARAENGVWVIDLPAATTSAIAASAKDTTVQSVVTALGGLATNSNLTTVGGNITSALGGLATNSNLTTVGGNIVNAFSGKATDSNITAVGSSITSALSGLATQATLNNLYTAFGTKADSAVTDFTASASEIAILKGIEKLLSGYGSLAQKGVPYKNQASSANSTNTVTLTAVAGQKYRIYGYSVKVTGAATTSAIDITLTDNATVAWTDGIPVGTAIDNVVGVMFPQPLIASAVNTAFTITASAGGASVITTINVLYDTM